MFYASETLSRATKTYEQPIRITGNNGGITIIITEELWHYGITKDLQHCGITDFKN